MDKIAPLFSSFRFLTKFIRQSGGQALFFSWTEAYEVLAEKHDTRTWTQFIGKQSGVFRYQQLHRGCSLNDNGFLLARYRRGTGD